MVIWATPPTSHNRTVFVAQHVGEFACRTGDLTTARRWLQAASWGTPADEESAWLLARAEYRNLRAHIALAEGRPEEGRGALAPLWKHIGVARAPDILEHLILATQIESELADRRAHTRDPSADSAIEAIRATSAAVARLTDLALAQAAHLDAELAHAAGDDDPARWHDVVTRWRDVGHVPYLAQALTRLGAAHLRAKDGPAAEGPLTEALNTASDLGYEELRTQIIKLAHRHRLRLADGPASPGVRGEGRLTSLTPRELEVLGLVAQVRSDNEIADDLFISDKTVSDHVSHILAKLGVK
jgi:DNA-binding CsgD family transcriptional regulator